jgi:hypothetical protein
MIGTMAFMAESKVPGSVPALAGKIASCGSGPSSYLASHGSRA